MTSIARTCAVILFAAFAVAAAARPQTESEAPRAGVWRARAVMGPSLSGALVVERGADVWRAAIAGVAAEAPVGGDALALSWPHGAGAFRGRVSADGSRIDGFWSQPPTTRDGVAFDTPVTLVRVSDGVWRGDVAPVADTSSFALHVGASEGERTPVFLRDDDRNIGRIFGIERLDRDGGDLALVGRFFGRGDEQVFATGRLHDDPETLSLFFDNVGRTLDFTRDDAPAAAETYRYRRPADLDDGWETATLDEAGLDASMIEALVDRIRATPDDSARAPQLHALLVARHGKLVFEEYFNGYDGVAPHDLRSASKSISSMLIGSEVLAGDLTVDQPVYALLRPGAPPEDPRARAITVEHLLTMSSGLDCDDNDDASPGGEEMMQSQTEEPDWWRYTLDLAMVRAPGEEAVYCSASPNLLGDVLHVVTGERLPELFQERFAEPLGLSSYHMNLMPTGEAYFGGGLRLTARDFLKFGQVMLDDGVWRGRRLLPEGWAARSGAPLFSMNNQGYGYAWWVNRYPYGDGEVASYNAGGNGGQLLIVIPELDLVALTFGGNYADFANLLLFQHEYVGGGVAPAVKE